MIQKINEEITKKFDEFKKSLEEIKQLEEKHRKVRDDMSVRAKKISDALSLNENAESLSSMEKKLSYYENDYKDVNKNFYSFIDYSKKIKNKVMDRVLLLTINKMNF